MSSPTGGDLESQRGFPQHQELGRSGVHETITPQVGQGRSENSIINDDQPKINDGLRYASHVGRDEGHIERDYEAAIGTPPVNGGPPDGSPDLEPRIVGDFGGSANALWTLYGKEAKNHDEVGFQTLKDDMDAVLTFTGLFAVILTAFIIDGKQNLKVNPTDQMAYYLQQNVAMLDQISRQIFSIAPQISIPSAPPAPFPAFKPSASDVRVNVFWFMSLIFSLSAALLATLVQQWVRDYMHVFPSYKDPLTSARLRQYLFEGSIKWYMRPVAEAVPALLHVSLFLFFVGLCDFVLNINTTIGLTTTIPIAITSLLYIVMTVAQVIRPQSPYRNPFSGLVWYLIQKISGYRGWNKMLLSVSLSMANVKRQFAMETTVDRRERDRRAIQWLASGMNQDEQIESFVEAIPGSFDDEWGMSVWKEVLNPVSGDRSRRERSHSFIPLNRRRAASNFPANTSASLHFSHQPGLRIQGEDAALITVRVRHLFDTCKSRGLFAAGENWRKRTRACIEAIASLVCCAGANFSQFGDADMLELLGNIGDDQAVRESSSVGRDQLFVMRWTCLSLVVIQPVLESTRLLHNDARQASRGLERTDDTGETRLEKMIKAFDNASSCLESFAGLPVLGETEDRVKEILGKHELQISELEQIDIEDFELGLDDWSIGSVQQSIDRITHGIITRQLPGIKSDIPGTEPHDVSQFIELYRDPRTLLFISPLRNLRRIRSFAQTIRNILQGHDVDALQKFQKTIKDLREIQFPRQSDSLFRRQMWRLQDLQDGGLGFIVELFFLALKQLLSNSSSKESHSALYIGTFRAIISDWGKYKHSLGTQGLLLKMVSPDDGIIFSFDYPDYIVNDFLAFICNILDGETGPHIDDVIQQLTDFSPYLPRHDLSVKVLGVIRRSQAPSL